LARIILSALVDEIKGKWNGDIFQTYKGITYRKKGTRPRQPRSIHQTSNRQFFSYLSGQFDSLSSGFQYNWNYYAGLVSNTYSGFNAFISLNQTILCANYSTLVRLYNAPPERKNPSSISDFVFTYDASKDTFIATWSSPLLYNYYVQCFYSVVTGYRDTLYPAWSFSQTVSSNLGYIYIAAGQFVSNTQVNSRLRVLNCYGERSSYSSTLTSIKT